MPWNESRKMDEKLKFVSRYLDVHPNFYSVNFSKIFLEPAIDK